MVSILAQILVAQKFQFDPILEVITVFLSYEFVVIFCAEIIAFVEIISRVLLPKSF